MRLDIAREVHERLDRSESFALATVVRTRGSVPGKLGFQMLVRPDGSQVGTVGGAGLELAVHEACMEAMASGRSTMLHHVLDHKHEGGLDSLCGGSADVFIHAVARSPHILLVGGGHVNHEVAKLCDQLGYRYSVMDDRPDFVSAERFPNAQGRHRLRSEDLEEKLDLAPFSHILIAGYDHKQDFDVLRRVLPRFRGHLASIGSKKRRKQFFDKLRELGHDQERIDSIECPVGLAIGAQTPAEIAVSILASFIQRARLTPGSGE